MMPESLTEAARSVWGKTDRTGKSPVGWLPLWRHLADTAGVAQRLWDGWLSRSVARLIGSELPGGTADGRTLATWLAGIHDIGKATPAFAIQAENLARRMSDLGLKYDRDQIKADRRMAPHATAGHILLADWLTREHGWDDGNGYAVVVGGHHGAPPTYQDIAEVTYRPHLLGDDAWAAVQHELLEWMAARTGADERLTVWAGARLSQPVQVALTGLVIVADWIASNEEFFPYTFAAADDRVGIAWEALALPTPWLPVTRLSSVDDLFTARFELPAGATPRPVQRAVVEQAATMAVPGLMIMEAPMGEGKTEAALAAAEVLAARTGATGCFIGLPSRATSDAMFARVLSWLQRLPDAELNRGDRDVMLAHGKAAFNNEYASLLRHSLPSGIGEDQGGVSIGVHDWLAGRKRSLLSSFVVGTIDQVLLAALRARHLALRHLGLAGKIVIIDEAHAYDVYMSAFLDRTLQWLGAYGVPVIVLSATLPAARRADMMAAYDRGRLGPLPPRTWRDRGKPEVDHYASLRTDLRYPILTTSVEDRGAAVAACADSGRSIDVRMNLLDDDLDKLAALLQDKLSDGGCALVVRNTVARVQETAQSLRDMLGPEYPLSVAHSRFMATDRAAKDAWLRSAFGPGGARPDRHIVVASQVAEQSLDIDFDLLITDLAPVDLVLQRIGRLHRHPRLDRPAPLARATCYVTGADWSQEPPKPVAGSRRVYTESALLRAAAVLWPYATTEQVLKLPQDIAPLTQAAYGTGDVGGSGWQPALAEAAQRAEAERLEKQDRARSYVLDDVGTRGTPIIGWLDAGVGNADDRMAAGHVRDGDGESFEVILLVRDGDELVVPPWVERFGGLAVPTDSVPPPWLGKAVARCTLPLPRMMTEPAAIDRVIADLERRSNFPAWRESRWLEGELVLEVDGDGRATLSAFDLHYDVHEGLHVSRRD